MRTHEIKTWPGPFADIQAGRKTAEFRFNDRGYEVGDILVHHEYDPTAQRYTGNRLTTQVRHVLADGYGITHGYCMMSIALCGPDERGSIDDLLDKLPDGFSLERTGVNWVIVDNVGKQVIGTGWHCPIGALEIFHGYEPSIPFALPKP